MVAWTCQMWSQSLTLEMLLLQWVISLVFNIFNHFEMFREFFITFCLVYPEFMHKLIKPLRCTIRTFFLLPSSDADSTQLTLVITVVSLAVATANFLYHSCVCCGYSYQHNCQFCENKSIFSFNHCFHLDDASMFLVDCTSALLSVIFR